MLFIAVVKNVFRMTFGKPKFKIPLSPFAKGERYIDWTGVNCQFAGKKTVPAQNVPPFEKGGQGDLEMVSNGTYF